MVTDAEVIRDHYRSAYGRETEYFPYGASLDSTDDDGTLGRLGLKPGTYVLYVSRLEPENNAHVVIDAYRRVTTDLPLAIVGDAPYASDYIARLKETADPRVRFTGAVYGTGYRILQSHAAAYVQATEVGGTHPALVEAMGHGNAIVANDVPEHRETLGDAGRYYRGPDGAGDRTGRGPRRSCSGRHHAYSRPGTSQPPVRVGRHRGGLDPRSSRASPARTARTSPSSCSRRATASSA